MDIRVFGSVRYVEKFTSKRTREYPSKYDNSATSEPERSNASTNDQGLDHEKTGEKEIENTRINARR